MIQGCGVGSHPVKDNTGAAMGQEGEHPLGSFCIRTECYQFICRWIAVSKTELLLGPDRKLTD